MKRPAHPAPLPRRDRKIAAILDAAMALFIEAGYAGTSMEAISVKARVSKPTLYAHFDNKETLFAAVVRNYCKRIWEPSGETVGRNLTLRQQLLLLAERFIEVAYAPASLVAYRLVIGESTRFPALAPIVHENAIVPLMKRAETLLGNAAAPLSIEDIASPVEQFFALLWGPHHFRVLLGLIAPPTKADRKRLARCGVDTFLAAFPAGKPRPDRAGAV